MVGKRRFIGPALLILTLCLLVTSTSLSNSAGLAIYGVAMTPAARGDLLTLDAIPYYWIEVNVDLEKPGLTGQEEIIFTNNEGVALEEIYLRLYPNGRKIYGDGGLEITEISVAGHEVQPRPELEVEETALRVPLSAPLAPGEKMTLEVEFTGTVPRDFASASGWSYGIYNYTEGVMALANWYPILAVFDDQGWNLDPVYGYGDAVYSDVGLYEIFITVPIDVVVVATGTELCKIIDDGDAITYHYISGPMRDFFIALSRDFRVLSKQIGHTVVNSYYYQPESEVGGQAALEVGTAALQIFNQRFGLYPYAELDILEMPLPGIIGVEYPGLIIISDDLYYSPGEVLFEEILSHETAHQWFYGVVGNDVIDVPWLDEALATYSSGIFFEETYGEGFFRAKVREWQIIYEQARRRGIQTPITGSLSDFPNGQGYTAIVYYGGALFHQAVREEIGDEAFFASLQQYYQDFKYKIATTDELLAIFEELSAQELDELYEQWLFPEWK